MGYRIYSIDIFSIVLILLKVAQPQVIQPGCTGQDACSCKYQDGSIVQLKFLGEYIKKEKTGGYLTVTGADTYSFNPCDTFNVPKPPGAYTYECTNVLACQNHDKSSLYDIGSSTMPPTFTSIDNGVKITYQTGHSSSWPVRKSMVSCICDDSYTGLPGFSFKNEDPTAQYNFDMRHACCCKNRCKDGMAGGSSSLSGGSILLIIMFVLLIVYLVLGGLFMKYKKGAIGSEVIPNKAFWGAIPGLVRDGIWFVLTPCTKRSSYNQV